MTISTTQNLVSTFVTLVATDADYLWPLRLERLEFEPRLGVEDLQGGTFTLTNTGGAGGVLFVPIINHPQAAILGMGRAALEPVVRSLPSGRHEIVPRLMLPVILTMDHRILDGGDATRFLKVVTGALADPEELMLLG